MTDTTGLKNDLEAGRQAHLGGDVDSARAIYESMLEKNPDNSDAMHLLASLKSVAGEFEAAEKLMRKALKLNRKGVGFQNTLGDILTAQQRFREAESAYFEELKMRPDFALSHNQIANLMLRSGDVDKAIKHYKSAVELSPDFVLARVNLGKAYIKSENYQGARTALEGARSLDPQSEDALAYLGLVEVCLGNLAAASHLLDAALKLNPDNPTAGIALAEWYLKQSKVHEAIEEYTRVIEHHPKDLEALSGLANVWRKQGIWEQAERYYKAAIEVASTKVGLFNQLAQVQVLQGRNEEALASYERALQIRPSDQPSLTGYGILKAESGDSQLALTRLSAVVHSGLAGTELLGAYAKLLGSVERGREGIAILEQRLRTKVPAEEGMRLRFTLAELLDSDSSYDLAYYYFREANLMNTTRFDLERFQNYCDSLIKAFNPTTIKRLQRSTVSEKRLVFLVGMPRSGIGVLQDLLGRDERIYKGGSSTAIELSAYRMAGDISSTWPECVEALDQATLDRYAQEYLARFADKPAEQPIIVDGTWRNFLYIGLIELLFPEARIVYCARDYRDVALSCFFTDFDSQSRHAFAHNLRDIAEFINQHKRLMNNWQQVSSLPIHQVSYERLILDYDDEMQALSNFIGLSDNIGDNQVKEEKVLTEKLPKPSYLKSVSLRRHRHYKNHLDVFLEHLDSPPDEAY